MLKKRITWILVVYILLIILLAVMIPQKIDWVDNFRSNSKIPYGSYILFEELDDIFDDLELSNESLYSLDKNETSGNYIIITNNFYTSPDEIDNLLEWVSAGNQAFISASYFDQHFLDTLNLESSQLFFNFSDLNDDQYSVKYVGIDSIHENSYTYDKQYDAISFENKYDSLINSEVKSVISSSSDNNAVLMKHQFGQGFLYIHSLPRVFTNYNMLKEDLHKYASRILSLLPNTHTIWNDYYKPASSANKSKLKIFLDEPSFKWAIYIGLALLLTYLVFNVKRKQRTIPILKAPENRSLEFTKTIGDLYFNTDDSMDLCSKMERHFKEFIKEKYFMYNFIGSDEDIHKLVDKSGRSFQLLSNITQYFTKYKKQNLSSTELINLNQQLHKFYYGGE